MMWWQYGAEIYEEKNWKTYRNDDCINKALIFYDDNDIIVLCCEKIINNDALVINNSHIPYPTNKFEVGNFSITINKPNNILF